MNHQVKLLDYIHVDGYSSTPKYLQLAYAILGAVKQGKIQRNKLLPSLNELTDHLDISRETADRGYKYLQQMGLLKAVPGKGHYIAGSGMLSDLRICLLLNKISEGKNLFYQSFITTLGTETPIDFYVYNNDFTLFKEFLSKNKRYSHYVIMPHFKDNQEVAETLINQLPKEKLILLDKYLPHVKGHFGGIYEHFAQDIYNALENALERLSNYHSLKLIFPRKSYLPEEIKEGFDHFCQEYAFEREVITTIKDQELSAGEVYICLNDYDLVTLLEKVEQSNLELGKEVGLISYNETPLKKYMAGGITTVSTDYLSMGKLAAEMIQGKVKRSIYLDFQLHLRNSL